MTVNYVLAPVVLLLLILWIFWEVGWGGVRSENSNVQRGAGGWHDIPRFFRKRRRDP